MSTGVRVPLHTAEAHAQTILASLLDACERIEVGGSIRRHRADVGDIELVAVPSIESDGLLMPVERNLLTERVDALIEAGTLAVHPTDPKRGTRYSKLLHPQSGLQVDLFSARPETFGLIHLLRTGPADYSRRFVTEIRQRGLHVSGGEVHRGGRGCGQYDCDVVPTPTEEDVYTAAVWPFVRPEDRA